MRWGILTIGEINMRTFRRSILNRELRSGYLNNIGEYLTRRWICIPFRLSTDLYKFDRIGRLKEG